MYLKRLPLAELKVDKSFVQDVPHDINDVALVETILSVRATCISRWWPKAWRTWPNWIFCAARDASASRDTTSSGRSRSRRGPDSCRSRRVSA